MWQISRCHEQKEEEMRKKKEWYDCVDPFSHCDHLKDPWTEGLSLDGKRHGMLGIYIGGGASLSFYGPLDDKADARHGR